MAESDGGPVVGRTRWRRALIVLVPVYAAVAGILFLAASGSLAVSFSISGTNFDTFANSLSCGVNADGTLNATDQDGNGQCFYQLGVIDVTRGGTPTSVSPQVESVFPHATIVNLCQSVSVPTPFGAVTVITRAGRTAGSPVSATSLITDAGTTTATSANFTNIRVGQDLSGFTSPAITEPVPVASPAPGANVTTTQVPVGTFGQTATNIQLQGLHSTGQGTQAASFTLPGLSLALGAPFGAATSCP